MQQLLKAEPKEVFEYFKKICSIPRGSGNMEAISKFCMKFAEENGLKAVRDKANNVIIYKPGTKGYEDSETVILQGHIDMVCQKTAESNIDFEKDGIEIVADSKFIRAKGTTLGADNGIAVAMIMAILSSNNLPHPPIEAVFTTDEEIGMIGAGKLDISNLKGKKMINIDSEEADVVTVSCAGGCDCKIILPVCRKTANGTKVKFEIKNLKGGHSGTEIDKGRMNANILAGRLLSHVKNEVDFDIIKINGGTKGNAIPFECSAELAAKDGEGFVKQMNEYFAIVKNEIKNREEECFIVISIEEEGSFKVLDSESVDKLIHMLLMTPNGVTDMSAEIDGLVETSLNMGILETQDDRIIMNYALRSNKKSALDFLAEKMSAFALYNGCYAEVSGIYPPWEFKSDSKIRNLYVDTFNQKFGYKPKVDAIHAGLECAVFASKISDLDCISIGPDMFDVHTVNEKLSIPSAKSIYELLCEVLGKCK